MVDRNKCELLESIELKIVNIPCSGKIESNHLLRTFENWIDGVCVAVCHSGCCHFLTGNVRVKKRIEYVKDLLDNIGIHSDRLVLVNLASVERERFIEILKKINFDN